MLFDPPRRNTSSQPKRWIPAALVPLVLLSVLCTWAAEEPPAFPLWDQGAPGAKGTEEADVPTLTPYPAPTGTATGVGIVVCPGGGYGNLAVDHEGRQIADWLNGEGIAAFVLRYRHAPGYGHPYPLMDVRRALRTVRARAPEWGVDRNRIGVLGFSAGGHLTASAATQFEPGDEKATEPIERVSSRPDFAVLLYPVITMTGPHTHKGSRRNLLGKEPDPSLIEAMSAEKRVTAETPPTFLVHTGDDRGVPVENSVLFYSALREAGVPAEMHIYEHGPHGFGLGKSDPALSTWPGHCIEWLRTRAILK